MDGTHHGQGKYHSPCLAIGAEVLIRHRDQDFQLFLVQVACAVHSSQGRCDFTSSLSDRFISHVEADFLGWTTALEPLSYTKARLISGKAFGPNHFSIMKRSSRGPVEIGGQDPRDVHNQNAKLYWIEIGHCCTTGFCGIKMRKDGARTRRRETYRIILSFSHGQPIKIVRIDLGDPLSVTKVSFTHLLCAASPQGDPHHSSAIAGTLHPLTPLNGPGSIDTRP